MHKSQEGCTEAYQENFWTSSEPMSSIKQGQKKCIYQVKLN